MVYLFSLIGPFFLLLVENFFNYPYVVEEVYKFFLVKKPIETKQVFAVGLFFSISESIFYVFNPVYINNFSLNIQRLLLVLPMHITTLLVVNYFNKKGNLWFVGLLTAVFIHYLFNTLGSITPRY